MKAKRNNEEASEESVEDMDVDFNTEKDKEEWKDLLQNCGLANGKESLSSEAVGKGSKKKKKGPLRDDEESVMIIDEEATTSKKKKKKSAKSKSIEADNSTQDNNEVVIIDEEATTSNSKKKSAKAKSSDANKSTQDNDKASSSKETKKKKKKKPAKDVVSTNEESTSSKKKSSNKKDEENAEPLPQDDPSSALASGNHGNLAFCKTPPPDRPFILIKQKDSKWHTLLTELSSELLLPSSSQEPINEYWSEKMLKYASRLLTREEEVFKETSLKSSQYAWSEKILSSTKYGGGTLKDKLNIHTVRLQESPLHHIKSLEALIAHVNPKSRRPMSLCMDILTDIFSSELLAPGRKLKSFLKNPFRDIDPTASPEKRDRLILLWYWESLLKDLYGKYLDALKEVSMDQIEKTKMDAMSKTLALLIANPERESLLLERLVNKLGDPLRPVASRAIYQLSSLLDKHHPAMKIVVVKEVERLLFRNNVNPKAQYYGICFLSQIKLNDEEEPIAKKLIQIYFSFFKSSIKKGEIDSKLMSGLLTGVNRAIPYAKGLLTDSEEFVGHIGTLYKVVQMSSFNISIQALSLLYQTDGGKERYFSSIYKKAGDSQLVSSSKQALFFNLLFKTLKSDPEARRVKAFIKRLLQVSSMFKPPLACAILFLISEVLKARPELGGIFTSTESSNSAVDMRAFESDDEEEEQPGGSSSWVHANNALSSQRKALTSYDPFARNPLYAGAECSHPWELEYLRGHYHPSVGLFARNVSAGSPIGYSGDPLADFTLIRFLDRFVFRNPKKTDKKHNPLSKKEASSCSGVLNGDDESNVPQDELFIYKYLKKRAEKKGGKDGGDEESWEDDSVTSEEFDRYLDRMADFAGENDDVDFATNIAGESAGKKKAKKNEEVDDEDDESEGESSEGEELDEDSDFDEEAFDIEEEDGPPKKKSKKKSSHPLRGPEGLQGLLASAEEFAEMIENDEATGGDAGGSSALSNRDNSGLKQMQWEKSRHGGGFKKKSLKRKRT